MPDTKEPTTRDSTGRFVDGNPGGSRKRIPEQVREMFEVATPKAAKRLIEALDATKTLVVGGGEHAHTVEVDDHDMRVKAANHIMDRLYGKPAQAITGEDGRSIMASVILLPAVEK